MCEYSLTSGNASKHLCASFFSHLKNRLLHIPSSHVYILQSDSHAEIFMFGHNFSQSPNNSLRTIPRLYPHRPTAKSHPHSQASYSPTALRLPPNTIVRETLLWPYSAPVTLPLHKPHCPWPLPKSRLFLAPLSPRNNCPYTKSGHMCHFCPELRTILPIGSLGRDSFLKT